MELDDICFLDACFNIMLDIDILNHKCLILYFGKRCLTLVFNAYFHPLTL